MTPSLHEQNVLLFVNALFKRLFTSYSASTLPMNRRLHLCKLLLHMQQKLVVAGSWPRCAISKSWELPMNRAPSPRPLPLRGREGARRAGEGALQGPDARFWNRGGVSVPSYSF